MIRKSLVILFKIGKNPIGLIGLLIIFVLLLSVIYPRLFTSTNPFEMNVTERLRRPDSQHPLGTDEMGRDIFARIVHGARLTLSFSFGVIITSIILGVILGGVAGFLGGWVDTLLMRISDIFLAFPQLILAMVIVACLGTTLFNAMIALSLAWWAQYARLFRGQVLAVKEELYVEAARTAGSRDLSIFVKEILPNSFPPIIVKATLDMSLAILLLSALSFIGLGAQPPIPEWGAIIATARRYLIDYWWYPTFPGLAIFVASMSFNLVGDVLRDLLDPRLAK
jgi:peptide/nickel transport system permease protein